MNFVSDEHKRFYESHRNITAKGTDYEALIYLLGVNRDCRAHFSELYDAKDGQIIPESTGAAWQTTASRNITRAAFNLFTYQIPEPEKTEKYAVKELFSGLDDTNRKGLLLALQYFA